MKVSIIIPAYNEEKRIDKTLSAYSKYFDNLVKKKELNYEIIVSINNTTDKTLEIVKKHKKKNKKIRYLNLKPGGKGFAVIKGFKDALKRKNDLIGFVDADMATPPQAFHYLIKNINENSGIIASRYHKHSVVHPKQTWKRIASSRMFNALVRIVLFLPLRDTQCGAKLFKRKALERTLRTLTMSQWAFDVDLLYNMKKLGYSIKEAPTMWSDKSDSKINFLSAGPFMALGVIRLRLINSPLKFIVKAYDKITNFL